MGWTEQPATHFKNGGIDRKAEMDALWTRTSNGKSNNSEVLRSTLIGTVWYAAVKISSPPAWDTIVMGVVAVTSVKGNNIIYKDMPETMLPYYFDCPKAILKMLTPTENENALEWRKMCAQKVSKGNSLTKLPVNTVIKIQWGGRDLLLRKHAPAYQFKRPFWYIDATGQYFKTKLIPNNYELVSMG